MGYGDWDTNVYADRKSHKAATGRSAFDYSDDVIAGRTTRVVHESLNPHGVALRESRDNAEHPTSKAITVLFDVTGSMGHIPRALQRKLPELLGLLLRKGYVIDPQVQFGAIGDATCDSFPFQIGQWESDNRMDENLEKIILEGGGGPSDTESYELAMYFMARHTAMDCWEKRGEKGYLFIIGDERAYDAIDHRLVQDVLGESLQENIPTAQIVAELKERFHVFYILPKGASHGGSQRILDFWRNLLGQNVLELDDPEAVCETIALTVGQMEDAIDLDEGADHLRELGVDERTVASVSKALAKLGADGKPATTNGSLPGLVTPTDTPSATRRI